LNLRHYSKAPRKVKGNAIAPVDASEEVPLLSSDSPRTPLDPERPTPETPTALGGLLRRPVWWELIDSVRQVIKRI
jgi:hypothetical protein